MKVRVRGRSRPVLPAHSRSLAAGLYYGNIPKSNLAHITCAMLASVTTGGSLYGFSLYANALKHSLHLTQAELTTVSSASFLAGLLSWAPGLLVDRFGGRCALITGGCASALSLFTFWAVAGKLLLVPRSWLIWTLSALGIVICMAVALVTGSVFKLIVSTCGPASKGAVVGAAKGYVGLGAGAYAILFAKLGRESDLDSLLMIGSFNFIATTVPALLLLPSNAKDDDQRLDDMAAPHFRTIYFGLAGLGTLVVGQSIMSLLHGDDENEDPDYVQFGLVWAVWMGPVLSLLIHPRPASTALLSSIDEDTPLVVVASPQSNSVAKIELVPTNPITGSGASQHQLVAESTAYKEIGKKTEEPITDEKLSPSLTTTEPRHFKLLEMLLTVEAWLLCWTSAILTGGGTLMTANMGQMAESLSLHDNVTPAALALFCAAQALSRVLTGVVSDHCLQSYEWARPGFLMVASFAGALSHIVLAFATHEVPFVLGVALSGVAFGMVWPLVVLIVGELFGAKHMGANYMFFDGFATAVGTLLVTRVIATGVYDQHVIRTGQQDETTCYGEGCFQLTHLIVAALSTTCVFTSLCLLNTKLSKVAYQGAPTVLKRH